MTIEPRPPTADEFHTYCGGYIALVPPGSLLDTLASQIDETVSLLGGVDAARAHYRYAPGKWTVTDIVGHLADTERILSYRALRFVRGDTTALPGFEENDYAAEAGYDARPLPEVVDEFAAVRRATLALFRGFAEETWGRRGTANGQSMTARAAAWIIAGHERHHRGVLRERYGLG